MVLLFVRAPQRGTVKTRLQPVIGEEGALDIYRCFILDILDTLRTANLTIRIFFSPTDSREEITDWLGHVFDYTPQTGESLGERMENAFVQMFSEGTEKAVLIGSDIPDLPASIFYEAFAALDANDAVIGPATDGGYYLIGFRNNTFMPEIFRGIKWSSGSVFRITMDIFEAHGCRPHVLPIWNDLDTGDDLRHFFLRNRRSDFAISRTMSYLNTIAEKLIGHG
ncbi:MAG TPA: TIGR04282 family arsenosugar biosynthesis glycosyltransferase [Dissulfurispiraceae bacterium]|nr:TIGR04282 family arsenosugar biosynthesis glycosyltransferase [Dissulfurispiraceae bacterium]